MNSKQFELSTLVSVLNDTTVHDTVTEEDMKELITHVAGKEPCPSTYQKVLKEVQIYLNDRYAKIAEAAELVRYTTLDEGRYLKFNDLFGKFHSIKPMTA